jgi:hypothetical protein
MPRVAKDDIPAYPYLEAVALDPWWRHWFKVLFIAKSLHSVGYLLYPGSQTTWELLSYMFFLLLFVLLVFGNRLLAAFQGYSPALLERMIRHGEDYPWYRRFDFEELALGGLYYSFWLIVLINLLVNPFLAFVVTPVIQTLASPELYWSGY